MGIGFPGNFRGTSFDVPIRRQALTDTALSRPESPPPSRSVHAPWAGRLRRISTLRDVAPRRFFIVVLFSFANRVYRRIGPALKLSCAIPLQRSTCQRTPSGTKPVQHQASSAPDFANANLLRRQASRARSLSRCKPVQPQAVAVANLRIGVDGTSHLEGASPLGVHVKVASAAPGRHFPGNIRTCCDKNESSFSAAFSRRHWKPSEAEIGRRLYEMLIGCASCSNVRKKVPTKVR